MLLTISVSTQYGLYGQYGMFFTHDDAAKVLSKAGYESAGRGSTQARLKIDDGTVFTATVIESEDDVEKEKSMPNSNWTMA